MEPDESQVHAAKRYKVAVEAAFTLRNCDDVPPSCNPQLCSEYPLREEQLRSLGWMKGREQNSENSVRGGILADRMGYGKTAITIGLLSEEPRVRSERLKRSPSGLLEAGGTLILAPRHLMQQWVSEFKKFLGAEHTQILRPKQQKPEASPWRVCMSAKVEACCDPNSPPEKGVHQRFQEPRRDDRLRVLVIQEMAELLDLQWGDFLDVDVVLVCYQVLSHPSYSLRIRALLQKTVTKKRWELTESGVDSWAVNELRRGAEEALVVCRPPKKKEMMELKLLELVQRAQEWTGSEEKLAALPGAKFPLFNIFWWKRIVMDEFHESESWDYKVRELFKGIGATHRWGLSGTPPIADVESIDGIADMMWAVKRRRYLSSTPVIRAPRVVLTNIEAQSFLDDSVRQSASPDVEKIELVSKAIFVELSASERLLYTQACFDNQVVGNSNMVGLPLERKSDLLKRCCHFTSLRHSDEAFAGDADQEVLRVSGQKEKQVRDIREQIALELTRLRLLDKQTAVSFYEQFSEAMKGFLEGDEHVASLHRQLLILFQDDDAETRRVTELAKQIQVDRYGLLRELLPVARVRFAAQPVPEKQYCKNKLDWHRILHGFAKKFHPEAAKELQKHEDCQEACRSKPALFPALRRLFPRVEDDSAVACLITALLQLFRMHSKAARSKAFMQHQMGVLAGDADSRSCSICLDEGCAVESMGILPCAHSFHLDCIRASLAHSRLCPECRQIVPAGVSATPLRLELGLAELAPAKDSTPAHGTKLSLLARKLREIREEDSTAKVIVFSQWADIEEKVSHALTTYGIPHLRCKGVRERGETLRIFQEKQAIARVRRLGQRRPQVFLHRFITKGTLEEDISSVHAGAV
mmetsp:Transcript_16843/g.39327  ORF Transcript_16843/g.39327 Transcript_16843/m.39327 type:complete len:868 (+) Transcript_16843:56-2659(+)